jgi:hypothetical protein
LGYESPFNGAIVYLINEKGIGNPRHLLQALVWQETTDQKDYAEANQHQVDYPKSFVGIVVVLAKGHSHQFCFAPS